jgi:CRISPR-associated endonuclease/helicase Cas3
MKQFKARYRTDSENEYQLLSDHLIETGMYVELFGKKIGLAVPVLLAALVHDLGKNCGPWQNYLEESRRKKPEAKDDHATAGGQFLYRAIEDRFGASGELAGLMLAACVMYHHGPGLPDVIQPDGTPKLYKRLDKPEEESHAEEAAANLDPAIRQKIEEILADKDFIARTTRTLGKLTGSDIPQARFFNLGLTARLLSSCLIDADRRSSAYFDRNIPVKKEEAVVRADWAALRKRLEDRLAEFPAEGKLNEIRRMVSDRSAGYAKREDDIYTLTAATGAGKTLASLRYALARVEYAGKDRIFIIAPYTSILDQNADIIRGILDPRGENGNIVLEHHSNLDQSEKTEHFIDSAQTWNAPVIITTMVQFLEAFFGSGTRKIRRMHQFVNSVIVFDEIQTLPVSCTYLFNWTLRYLRQSAAASILLCSATQPGFDRLKPEYALSLPEENEIIPDIAKHFEDLTRVELVNKTRQQGWTLDGLGAFIETLDARSVLTVVNTKSQARKLHALLSRNHPDWRIIHLTTDMCPVHRRKMIAKLKRKLRDKTQKCICVSTRLIEAGIDIDFNAAIRLLAGFDSIIQTAGRCNRSGELRDAAGNLIPGKTYIVNIVKDEEHIGDLPELVLGQRLMERIIKEFRDDEAKYNHTLLHPDLIARYFYYFYGQLSDARMKYEIDVGRTDTVLNMLSNNGESVLHYSKTESRLKGDAARKLTAFHQSFESAWKEFEVISQNTVGVIVPFKRGRDIINELYTLPDIQQCEVLLRKAQGYSVQMYFSGLKSLEEKGVIKRIPTRYQLEIYAVEEEHYDRHTGLTREAGAMTMLNV